MAMQPRFIVESPFDKSPSSLSEGLDDTPDLGEVASAAFQLENTFVSGMSYLKYQSDLGEAREKDLDINTFSPPPEEGYDVFDDIEGYSDDQEKFIGVTSPRVAQVIKDRIDKERYNRKVYDEGGWTAFFLGIGAAVVDPINAIPVGGAAVRGLKTGQSVGRNALNTGLAGAAGAALAEGVLQPTQLTRTAGESATSVIGGLLLGGVLGGSVGAFVAKDGISGPISTLGARILNDPATASYQVGNSSVGAAQVNDLTVDDQSVASSLGAFELLSFQSPMTRLVASKNFDLMRDTMDLVATPFRFNKNDDGVATTDSQGAVETQVKVARAVFLNAEAEVDDLFIQMRLGRDKKIGDKLSLAAKDKFSPSAEMNADQFKQSISDAFLEPTPHQNEFVQKAVEVYSNVYATLGREAEAAGLLPEGTVDAGIKTDGRYIPLDYNMEAIAARRTEVEKTFSDNFILKADSYVAELDAAETELSQLKFQQEDFASSLPDNQTLDIVRRGGEVDLGFAKRPVIDLLKSMGGVDPASELAGELAAFDVTPKNAPGLFKKGGRSSLDNLVESEYDLLRDNLVADERGYYQQDDILGLIAGEIGGDPARTFDQLAEIDAKIAPALSLIKFFDDKEIDYLNLTNDQLRARLLRLDDDEIAQMRNAGQEGDDGVSGTSRSLEDIEAEAVEMRAAGAEALPPTSKSQAERIEDLTGKIETLRKLTQASDPLLARQLAHEVVQSMLGASRMDLPDHILSGPSGPLKGRTLDIDPRLTKEFRNTDITSLTQKYTRTMMVDIGLKKKFGSVDMKRQFEKYADGFEKARHAAVTSHALKLLNAGKLDFLTDAEKKIVRSKSIVRLQEINNPELTAAVMHSPTVLKAHKKLQTQEEGANRDVRHMLKRVRGEYLGALHPNAKITKVENALLAANYLGKLGMQTVSAIPDLGVPVFKYGFRAFSAGWGQLLTNSPNYLKGSSQLKAMGIGIEMELDVRQQSITELYMGQGTGSKIEKIIDKTSRAFGMATLMTPWNAALKKMAGHIVQDFLHDAVLKSSSGNLPKKLIAELARMNIDPAMSKRVAAQISQHASDFKNTRELNVHLWSDIEASRNIQQALLEEVDRIVLTPGQTKPIWMDKEVGKGIGQFKSFGFDATQQIMVAGLQKRDAETMMGMVLMLTLGGAVYKIKEEAAGRETPDITENPQKWFVESLDRSGLMGWLLGPNNVIEKATRGKVGLSALTGAGPMSRYASRGGLESLLGPSAGLINDLLFEIPGAAFAGDWKASDTAKLRRALPFQNALVIRQLFDRFEEGANRSMGL